MCEAADVTQHLRPSCIGRKKVVTRLDVFGNILFTGFEPVFRARKKATASVVFDTLRVRTDSPIP